ncbi:hypothetical protein IM660_05430 [Ruania alkalisoli]|uniref:Uncharacterized protein n=1 Tax=Ruania alkalisoli TaxID=2779775 RepID=A0A7M1SVW1_9MICO|nr:hypothetical protein [Ruania alkalisoli]QOR71720.1 hypothetical protein IM660_05430 [Ruania alkalisoli]
MTQRFNPPPGWQVPSGFVPTPGWQPDPSWPAAPAGWNFWVDDATDSATAGAHGSGVPGAATSPGMADAGTPGVHAQAGAYDPAPSAGQPGTYASGQPGAYGQAGSYGPSPATGAGAINPAVAPGAGGFDASQAAGSASMALAEQQVKSQKGAMLIGFGVAAAAVLITIVSLAIAVSQGGDRFWFPWYFGLLGLALGIRGAIMHRKAKKELAAAQAASGGGLYGSGMGGTDLPGSGSNPNGDLYR